MGVGRPEYSEGVYDMDSVSSHIVRGHYEPIMFIISYNIFLNFLVLVVSLYFGCFMCTFGMMDTVWHL